MSHSSCNNQLDLERRDERGHSTKRTMRGGEVSAGGVPEIPCCRTCRRACRCTRRCWRLRCRSLPRSFVKLVVFADCVALVVALVRRSCSSCSFVALVCRTPSSRSSLLAASCRRDERMVKIYPEQRSDLCNRGSYLHQNDGDIEHSRLHSQIYILACPLPPSRPTAPSLPLYSASLAQS